MSPGKRRLLLVTVVLGLSLGGFGLYRWPPLTPDARNLTTSASEATSVFKADRSRYDVYIGFADYLASAFLLGLSLWILLQGAPEGRRLVDAWILDRWQGGPSTRVLVLLLSFSVVVVWMMSLWALIALFLPGR